jgi:hypothetical protein
MSLALAKQSAFNAATASAELIKKFSPNIHKRKSTPRELPMADEDVSMEIILPLSMHEIYDIRDRICD